MFGFKDHVYFNHSTEYREFYLVAFRFVLLLERKSRNEKRNKKLFPLLACICVFCRCVCVCVRESVYVCGVLSRKQIEGSKGFELVWLPAWVQAKATAEAAG